jgi:hypothetical protein
MQPSCSCSLIAESMYLMNHGELSSSGIVAHLTGELEVLHVIYASEGLSAGRQALAPTMLLLPVGKCWYGWLQVAEEEFSEEVSDGGGAGGHGEGLKGESNSSACLGVVGVCDAACCEVAEDVRVVGLVLAVIAAADEGGGQGVPGSRGDTAGALVEVAWVLMEEGWEDGAADDSAGDGVGQSCAIALSVALDAGAVAGIGAVVVLSAGDACDDEKSCGIGDGAGGKLVFLFGGHRSRVPDVAGVEVLNDTEDTLLFLFAHLLLRNLFGGCGDVDGGTGDDLQGEPGHFECLTRLYGKLAGDVGLEVWPTDHEAVSAGGQVREGEAAIAGGDGGSGFELARDFEGYPGVGDDVTWGIGNDSMDAGCTLGAECLQHGAGCIGQWLVVGDDLAEYRIGAGHGQ